MADDTSSMNPIELATELTIAWLANPNTRASSEEVPGFLNRMHEAVLNLSRPPEEIVGRDAAQEFTRATTVRRSLASKDHIISMIDGKPYKTLRRHLKTHGLTPEQYRERYNLKQDYPMVAPSYSDTRRSLAEKIGLGRKRAAAAAPAPIEQTSAPSGSARRGRKPTASGAAAGDGSSPAKASARRGRRRTASAAAPAVESSAGKAPARRGRKPKEAPTA